MGISTGMTFTDVIRVEVGMGLWVLCAFKLSEVGPIGQWSWWLVLTPMWVGMAANVALEVAKLRRRVRDDDREKDG